MIPTLNGHGELRFEDASALSGAFTLTHDLDAANGVSLAFTAEGDEALGFFARVANGSKSTYDLRPSLEGTTEEGDGVRARQLRLASASLSGGNKLLLRLLPRIAVEVGRYTEDCRDFEFLIPNLLFSGLVTTEHEGDPSLRSWRRDTVTVAVKHGEHQVRFTLRQLPGYDDNATLVSQTAKSAWTATLRVEISDACSRRADDTVRLVDDFLLLLSFASSRRVAWVGMMESEAKKLRRIRAGTTVNRKAFPGSVMGDGALTADGRGVHQPLSDFLGVAFPAYASFARRRRDAVAEAIACQCQALQDFFSPASLTLTGRAFEWLCSAFLDKGQSRFLAGPGDTSLRELLVKGIRAFVDAWKSEDNGAADEFTSELDGRVSGLLQRALRTRIQQLLDRYLTGTANSYDVSWIGDFVAARNTAAHSRQLSRKEALAWVKGNALLSRVLLKILGYCGPYVDFYGDSGVESRWSVLK